MDRVLGEVTRMPFEVYHRADAALSSGPHNRELHDQRGLEAVDRLLLYVRDVLDSDPPMMDDDLSESLYRAYQRVLTWRSA